VGAVRLVETHISWVFLTGQFAYKIKRPVHYPFVDLRSPAQRAFFCAEELRLNRRFAEELYLDVCAVTLADGVARISGQGEVIDHAVRMREFRGEDELDRLLARGAVEQPELEDFGRELAILHARLPEAGAEQDWGRPQSVRALLLQNLKECLPVAGRLGTQNAVRSLSAAYRTRLDAAEPWLASRRATGKVRECHGDLHARNVVRYGDRLLAFDCMEFEPAFRWIDVAEDLAFLFMDLEARHFAGHAQALLGGYLFQSGDYQACRVLRLYATHRALVRAKVTALEAVGAAQERARMTALEGHHDYLEHAQRMLAPGGPLLILIGGMSGSGKTSLAQRLAPRLGAVHVRSDVERKRIAGLAERSRSDSELEQGMYSGETSRRVYERLRQCAADVLAGGYSVIVDATFQRREERALLRAVAAQCAAAMHVIFCHAPRRVLQGRVAARRQAATDASEADLAVLEWQRTRFEPIRAEEGLRVIDTDTSGGDVMSRVLEQIGGTGA
jgi:aminoglycoside phosphotransferase family enzyme/predicted kinase